MKELSRVLAIMLLIFLSPLFFVIDKALTAWQSTLTRRYEALVKEIAKTDPEAAAKLRRDDSSDRYRIRQRSIELSQKVQEWFDQ